MVVSAPEYRFPCYRNLGFLRQEYPLKSMKNNFKIVEKLQKTRKYTKKSIVKKLEKVINL